MLAVGMVRGKPGVYAFELPTPQISQPDEVLVRVKEVGLDGTDFGMLREMITHHFQLADYQQAFALSDPKHIKTALEVEPWD